MAAHPIGWLQKVDVYRLGLILGGMISTKRFFASLAMGATLALAACDDAPVAASTNADARAALEKGQWGNAQAHLTNVFAAGAADETTQAIKLDLMLEMGDGYAAMAAIDALPESALAPAERRVAMAHALILEDNAQGAADLYEGMDPEGFTEQDYRMTLWILRELDEADQFEAGMDAALEAYPDSADLNAMAAEALIELDEPEEAAAYVERALASAPNHFEALLAKGELAIDAKDLEGALATYQTAAKAYPNHPLPLANIAGLQLDLDRIEAAGETLKSAITAHPDEPFLQWQLARYSLATDDLDTARIALETARRAFRSVDEFTLLSAQAEERFGSTSLALSEYKRYLRTVGEDDAIEAKVAALEAGVS